MKAVPRLSPAKLKVLCMLLSGKALSGKYGLHTDTETLAYLTSEKLIARTSTPPLYDSIRYYDYVITKHGSSVVSQYMKAMEHLEC
jgi:hypothetical protein